LSALVLLTVSTPSRRFATRSPASRLIRRESARSLSWP